MPNALDASVNKDVNSLCKLFCDNSAALSYPIVFFFSCCQGFAVDVCWLLMERQCLFVSVTVVMLFLTQWRWCFQKDSSLCVRLVSQVLLYTLSAAAEVNGVMSSSGGEDTVVSRGPCCTYQGGVDYKKAYHTCGSWDLSPFVWCIKFYYCY